MKKQVTSTLLLLTAAALLYSSCKKEYSFEGGNAGSSLPDTIVIIKDTSKPKDTIAAADFSFPSCASCNENNPLELNEWSFKVGNNYICGFIDTAILNYERTSFTFFGPSYCVPDKGLIFTVYLTPIVLNHTLSDFPVPYAAFYFYHTGNLNLLSSQTNKSFDLIITHYDNNTKITTGTFSGVAYTKDNKAVEIKDGGFKTHLF